MRTVDTILESLETMVRERQPIDSMTWMAAALDLTILMGDEHEKLYTLQSELNQYRASLIGDGKSVAHARAMTEAHELYKIMMIQKAKVERVLETIRVAKLQARIASEEMRNG